MKKDSPGKSIRSVDVSTPWREYIRWANAMEPPKLTPMEPAPRREGRFAGRTRKEKFAWFARNLAFCTSGASTVAWILELAIGSMEWALVFAAGAAATGVWGLRLDRQITTKTL